MMFEELQDFVECFKDIKRLFRTRYLEQCRCGWVMYLQKTGWKCTKCGRKNWFWYHSRQLWKIFYRLGYFLNVRSRLNYLRFMESEYPY